MPDAKERLKGLLTQLETERDELKLKLGLAKLEARVRQDLTYLCYPPANWVPPTHYPNAEHTRVHDVVVIGGGMCGLVVSFALLGAGIANLRIFDRSPQGR